MNTFARNRPLHARRRLALLGVGVVAYLLSLILAQVPDLVETAYGSALGPRIARALSVITGVVPFSLAEVFILAVALRQLVPGARALRHVLARERQLGNALAAGALRVGQDLGVLVALFYVLWGFHYSRLPLQHRLGWADVRDVTVEEVAALATQLVDAANNAYYEIHRTEDAGVPTPPPPDPRALEDGLAEGWRRAHSSMGLASGPARFGRVKRPLATPLYETFGVVGFYFPFTAEAHVRGGLPPSGWPQSVAHEQAHQRGVALESEANFWGFLSGTYSADPRARYSAYLFAQYQLLAALARADAARGRAIIARRLPGVQRDVDSARAYWQRLRGPGLHVGRAVNDAFLRTNRVPGGVESYSLSARLFLAYARKRNGRLLPD